MSIATNTVTSMSANMPSLKKRKSPGLAAVLGFLFGGIGLGIYFVSFIDFIIPVAIVVLAGAVMKAGGVFAGAVIAAFWGYFRALDSNKKLEAQSRGR